jgi:hypothetical protein
MIFICLLGGREVVLKKLNEQGQYSLDISTSCLNNVINIKNNVDAKELLLKFDSKISWI